jgi:hypothetical protein
LTSEILNDPNYFRINIPIDPEATWNLEIYFSDRVGKRLKEEVAQCAEFVRNLPQVTAIDFSGGQDIEIWGSISRNELAQEVDAWWTTKLNG